MANHGLFFVLFSVFYNKQYIVYNENMCQKISIQYTYGNGTQTHDLSNSLLSLQLFLDWNKRRKTKVSLGGLNLAEPRAEVIKNSVLCNHAMMK